MVLRLCLYGIIGYSALMVAAYLLQERMLYFPDRMKPLGNDVHHLGVRFWPDSGEAYRGFTGIVPPVVQRGLVVAFHGNAGRAIDRSFYVHALMPRGYRVVVAEYPGYGGRPGKLGERHIVEDGKETVRRAYEEFGGPVFLLGESLGSGVAAALAADPPVPIAGVVMITPWDSLTDVAQTIYWYFPVRLLIRDRYDNVRNLQSFGNPVAVVMAARDEIIPKKHSLRLYESLIAPKKLLIWENAGHNSWPIGSREQWWGKVMDFISAKQGRPAEKPGR